MADPLTNELIEIALRLRDIRQLTDLGGLSDRQQAAMEAIQRECEALMVAVQDNDIKRIKAAASRSCTSPSTA